MTAMHSELGEFVDRDTIRFVRRYPHPVELVWEMLTEPKHLEAWFMTAQLDLRVGGRFAFGPAEDPHLAGVIIALEPPTVIEFANTTTLRAYGYVDATERLRFELASVGDGCFLVSRSTSRLTPSVSPAISRARTFPLPVHRGGPGSSPVTITSSNASAVTSTIEIFPSRLTTTGGTSSTACTGVTYSTGSTVSTSSRHNDVVGATATFR